MKCVVYGSRSPVLHQALEEVKRKFLEEKILTDFDFMIISLNYRYPYENLHRDLIRIFDINGDEYFGFHSTESIEETKIHDGIAICFLKFENKGQVKVYWDSGISDYTSNRLLDRLVEYLEENRNFLNIFFSAWEDKNLGLFIEDLGRILGQKGFYPNLVGGVSSGKKFNGELRTYQFYKGKVIKDGFGILTFENFDFALGISLGFKPISPVYEVKKADGYKVYEVDGGVSFKEIVENFLVGLEKKVEYLWYCPIVLFEDEEGYVRVQRTFKEIGKDWVEFFAPVHEGDKFTLSFGIPEMLLQSTQEEINKMKEKLKYPELTFNFSCIARQFVLEERREEENVLISQSFDSPLFGFATYGEIGPDKYFRKVKLYNETATIVSLKEKEE